MGARPSSALRSRHDASGRGARTIGPVTVAVLVLVVVAGCTSGSDADPSGRAAPSGSSADTCDGYGRSVDEKAGGPLEMEGQNVLTMGMAYIPRGTLQDATIVPLPNSGDAPVRVDSVELPTDRAVAGWETQDTTAEIHPMRISTLIRRFPQGFHGSSSPQSQGGRVTRLKASQAGLRQPHRVGMDARSPLERCSGCAAVPVR